jgi:hypothetical protein
MASCSFDPRRAPLVPALILLLAAAPARAAEPPEDAAATKRAAEAKLVEGVDELKNRRYGEALERFQQAYTLVPSPLISYDLGLAYLGLGDHPHALESFDKFLLEAPDASGDKRRKAREYADELRGRVAVVTVSADVAAADLTVDGRPIGRVDVPRRLYMAPGWHEIIARDGRASATATVTCAAGEGLALSVSLTQPDQPPRPPPRLVSPIPPPAPAVVLESPVVREAPATHDRARIGALSAVAAGAVALGVGVTFGVMASSQGDSVTADSMNRRAFVPGTESAGLHDQTLEVVFLSVGAVAVAAGIAIYAFIRHKEGAGGGS